MQKALELIQSIPKQAKELDLIDNIIDYPGDKNSLGRIYRSVKFYKLKKK